MKEVLINDVLFVLSDKTAKLYDQYASAEANYRYMLKQGKSPAEVAKYERLRDKALEKLVS